MLKISNRKYWRLLILTLLLMWLLLLLVSFWTSRTWSTYVQVLTFTYLKAAWIGIDRLYKLSSRMIGLVFLFQKWGFSFHEWVASVITIINELMDYVLNQVNRIVEILSFSRVRVLHFKKKIDFVKVRYNMCICTI